MARTQEEKRKDAEEERAEKHFQNKVKLLHRGYMEEMSGIFTVAELKRLIEMPYTLSKLSPPKYTDEDWKWLQQLGKNLKKKEDDRIEFSRRFLRGSN